MLQKVKKTKGGLVDKGFGERLTTHRKTVKCYKTLQKDLDLDMFFGMI